MIHIKWHGRGIWVIGDIGKPRGIEGSHLREQWRAARGGQIVALPHHHVFHGMAGKQVEQWMPHAHERKTGSHGLLCLFLQQPLSRARIGVSLTQVHAVPPS